MGTAQVDVSRPRIDHHAVDAAKVLETIVSGVAVFYALVIALISFGYSILAYPQADDLERTAALRIFTRVQRITSDYNAIDGRWASKWIEYTLYKGGHVIERYPAMLMTVLVIAIIGCCCGISVISGLRISDRRVWGGGIIAYSFLWLSSPRGEVFYWFPATAEYVLPIALSMVLLWLLNNFDEGWSKILVVGLAFVLPPIHEVFGSWVISVLALTWLVRWLKKKPGSGTALAAALAGVAGTATVVLSPGIRRRAAGTAHQSIHDAFQQALKIEAFNTQSWIFIVPMFLVIVLGAAHLRKRPSWCDDAPIFIKCCLLIAMAPLPILMLTAISYGLGGGIPARVYDGFFLLTAIATATFAAACGFSLGRWEAGQKFLGSSWGSLLRCAVMILALYGAKSLPRYDWAFQEKDTAIRNRDVWVQRNAEIWNLKNSGVRDIVVSEHMLPLHIMPFYFDMSEDLKWYANEHLRTYYGVNSLRLSAPPQ